MSIIVDAAVLEKLDIAVKDGFVSLNNIFKTLKAKKARSPWHWRNSASGKSFLESLAGEGVRCRMPDILIEVSSDGTFAHPYVAAEYTAWATQEEGVKTQKVAAEIANALLFDEDESIVVETPTDAGDLEGIELEMPETFNFDPSNLICVVMEHIGSSMTLQERKDTIADLIFIGTGSRLTF